LVVAFPVVATIALAWKSRRVSFYTHSDIKISNVLGSGVFCCWRVCTRLVVVTRPFFFQSFHFSIRYQTSLVAAFQGLHKTAIIYPANNRDYNNSQDNNSTHQQSTPRQIRQLNGIEFEPHQNTSRSLSQNQNDFNDASARC